MDARTHYQNEEAVSHYLKTEGLLYKEILAFSHIQPQSRILDLGCGTGRTTEPLAEAGHDVIGTDIAISMTAAAKGRAPSIQYLASDASEMCFPDALFDVVLFSAAGIDLIYPFDKRRQTLREIQRVLKPGGLFLFGAHNHCIPRDFRGVTPFIASLFKNRRNGYVDDFHDSWGATKIYLTTPEIQIEELRDEGFEVVDFIQRRILRNLRSVRLIGLIDEWCFYVSRSVEN